MNLKAAETLPQQDIRHDVEQIVKEVLNQYFDKMETVPTVKIVPDNRSKEQTTFEKIIEIQSRHLDMFLSTYWELSIYTGIGESTFTNYPWLIPPKSYYGGKRWRIRDVIAHLSHTEEELIGIYIYEHGKLKSATNRLKELKKLRRAG